LKLIPGNDDFLRIAVLVHDYSVNAHHPVYTLRTGFGCRSIRRLLYWIAHPLAPSRWERE
jgi:hypothetical protein